MMDIDVILDKALADLGSSLIRSGSVRTALSDTNREMRSDSEAYGGSGEEPFWDMVSDERTHVFAVFGTDTLDLYAFLSPDFSDLINKLNHLAMADVSELRNLLLASYGVFNPEISIRRSEAETWLRG